MKPLILALVVFALSACGGSSSSGGNDDDNDMGFNGTWGGTLEDVTDTMHTLTLVVSGDTITSIRIDGVDDGVTGTLFRQSSKVFGFTLSDATDGGLIVDDSGQHLTFLDESWNIGVLQKNANSLPSFAQADIAGSGSGVAVTTDFNTFREFASSVTCDAAGACNGVDDEIGNFTASLAYTSLGRWAGTSNYATGSATVRVFLSADKSFAGSWACNFAIGSFPEACSFTAWTFDRT